MGSPALARRSSVLSFVSKPILALLKQGYVTHLFYFKFFVLLQKYYKFLRRINLFTFFCVSSLTMCWNHSWYFMYNSYSCPVEQQFEVLVFPMEKLNLEKHLTNFKVILLQRIIWNLFLCLTSCIFLRHLILYILYWSYQKKAANYIDAI